MRQCRGRTPALFCRSLRARLLTLRFLLIPRLVHQSKVSDIWTSAAPVEVVSRRLSGKDIQQKASWRSALIRLRCQRRNGTLCPRLTRPFFKTNNPNSRKSFGYYSESAPAAAQTAEHAAPAAPPDYCRPIKEHYVHCQLVGKEEIH